MQSKEAMTSKVLAPIEIDSKALSDTGEFEGYASVFGVKDQGSDIVMSGAFSESLAEAGPEKVKMLWQHDPSKPIGKWLEMREDGHGLYVKGRLILSLAQGKEAYELMREGIIDGLSIGYRTIEDMWDRDRDARKLMKVSLKEVSCVTFPMLEQATVSLVKGNSLPTEREFETWLKEVGFSSRQSKGIIANGYKAIQAQPNEADKDNIASTLREFSDKLRGR